MLKAIAWIALLLGVLIGASGAARNGDDHAAYRAAKGQLAVVQKASDTLEAARASGDAQALAAAEAQVQALAEAGTLPGSLPQAMVEAQQAVQAHPLPGPVPRFLGWARVGGLQTLVGLVLIIAGALVMRRQQHRESAGGAGSGQAQVDFPAALEQIQTELVALRAAIDTLEMDGPSIEVRERLDALQDDVITPVVDGRGQLIARHGLARFSIYFGAFSGGERNASRAWSALTDGHSVVARQALDNAIAAFEQAKLAWERAEAG